MHTYTHTFGVQIIQLDWVLSLCRLTEYSAALVN